jgi:hypothetical protein
MISKYSKNKTKSFFQKKYFKEIKSKILHLVIEPQPQIIKKIIKSIKSKYFQSRVKYLKKK